MKSLSDHVIRFDILLGPLFNVDGNFFLVFPLFSLLFFRPMKRGLKSKRGRKAEMKKLILLWTSFQAMVETFSRFLALFSLGLKLYLFLLCTSFERSLKLFSLL
jgi:hypothetical protein